MLIINTIRTLLIASFLQALFLSAADSPNDPNILSYSASEKGIEILGTILNSKNPKENVVLIKDASNKTMAKGIGYEMVLGDSFSVSAIRENYIELQSMNQKIRLYKYGFEPEVKRAKAQIANVSAPVAIKGTYKETGFEREDGNIKITEEYRKNMLEKDLPKILMQAAAEAKVDANGNIIGFALYDIDPSSVFAKAGLVDGDTIQSINGEELDSAPGAVKLLNSLRNANDVHFMIQRGGQSLPINLEVK